ncbi:hypothetical protein [Sangeribacter muris]|jgi:hypothetical protein|uniref:hypothetical protein n=1 Tax=Sangeribacter muris TaxID=2880703 RepID=UPI00244DC7BC|nr:hypothetical protein [Sangeribacter muris]
MNNRIIYLTAIFGNFLLLVYAAVLIVGICGGWLDRELWLHSDVAKVAQLGSVSLSVSEASSLKPVDLR